jgi:adenylate kinase family enzyme
MEVLFAGELVGKAIGTVAVTSSIGYFTTKSLDHLLSAPDKAKVQELLTRKLPTLQAILEAIDQNVVLDDDRHALDELLWQLRTSMEKVDDALDELEFYNLKKACRETLTASSPFIKLHLGPQISRKVSSCLKRLKSSMEELDLVSDGVASFVSHVGCMKRSKDSLYDQKLLRETSRWLTIGKVFGRDTEKEQLVQWLTTSLFAHQDVLAIAITGVGGVGKTTLAQYACHDERVLMHFDSIIWIHVSRHFDPLRLTKRILESLTKQVPAAESIDVLQSMLKRLLVSKRFLLILDDTWEEMKDLHKWQQFLIPLYESSVGSKILITTRMKSVILSIEYVLKRHGKYCMELYLDGLGSKPMLEVFKSCAFPMVNADDAQGFHLMSEEIVKRLNGCPLIATALGEYLWSKMDRSEWSSVLDPQFQYIAIPSVLEVLYLSYLNLPLEVQNCFRYCSLFPPKHKFSIEQLVDMWIGSGIISQRPGNLGVKDIFNMEAIARDYFDHLVRKSLLTVAAPLENHYIMPDLVYELACYVSGKEVLWISAANGNICVPTTVRHLSIEGINCEVIKDLSQYTDLHLRTLVIRSDNNGEGFSEPEVANNLKKLIKGSKSLRVLCLHGSNCFALKIVFSKLKHLRYVSASSIDASGLCEIFELHHMEVIKIQNVKCKEKMSFPSLGNLLKLRKLDLPGNTVSAFAPVVGFG